MIYTSSRVYFHIKNQISNSFNQFNSVLDLASIPRKSRGPGATNPKTQTTHQLDRGLIPFKPEVPFVKPTGRRG